MRKHGSSYISRNTKKHSIKMDEPNEEPEELTVEPSEESVPQSSLDRDNDESEEPEYKPGEEPIEELEEEPIEEPEEDPEEEPSEELEEEPAEEPAECVSQSLSNQNNDDTEQQIEDPDRLEDSVSKPFSETDADQDEYKSESVLNNSNERKRSLDATAGESATLQIDQSRKKCRQEEFSKSGSNVGLAVRDLHMKFGVCKSVDDESASEQQEHMGSSEKQRRSRWDTLPEVVEAVDDESAPEQQEHMGSNSENRRRSRWDSHPEVDTSIGDRDRTSKRRKTRWAGDDLKLKMLGPIQLPDFIKKNSVESDLDPQVPLLKAKLLCINSTLQNSKLHDDRPEKERSPSPVPVYNNLGIRINTREVRLRMKLVQERQDIISRLIQKNPAFKPRPDYNPPKFLKKLYVPVKEYPDCNFLGLILGPRGNTLKRMQKETRSRIFLRGKGSSKHKERAIYDNEDLHVLIETDNQKSMDAAVGMVEKLLNPVKEGMNEHKLAQLRELATLNAPYRDVGVCGVCGEQGHKHHYTCPQSQSTFKIASSCDTCGGSSHSSATCPSIASSHASSSVQGSSGLGLGPAPKKQNKHKEMSDANLYVGYLPHAVDDNRLRELFTPFGKLTDVIVIKDRTTGLSKGYGFVKFETPADATMAAMHMNGYKMDGKMLAVRVAGRPPVSSSPLLSHLPMYPGPPQVLNQVAGGPLASSSPVLSHLPMYPGPPAVPQVVPSQTDWPGPPGSMLPAPRDPFSKSGGVYIGHGSILPQSTASSFSPLSSVSSLPDSMSDQDPFPKSGSVGLPPSSTYIGHGSLLHRSKALSFFPLSGVSSLPDSMSAQDPFPKSEGLGLPPSSTYKGHGSLLPQSKASSFSPLSGVSSLPDSMSTRDPFPRSEGVGLLPSSTYIGHGSLLPQSKVSSFSPLSGVSSLPDLMSESSLNLSYKCSNQIQFSSPISQFPGDPDYPGSQFLSYFATPTVKPPSPYPLSQPPESVLKSFSWPTTHLP